MSDKKTRPGSVVVARWMAGVAGIVLAVLVLGYVLQSALLIVLWRTHWQPGLDAVRRFNKRVTSVSAATKSGKKGSMTTAVHTVGRRSGKPYVTPVWAERVGETFFIQLPYGTHVDWCRNVLAAGGCVLEHDGVRYDVDAPVIVPAGEARPHLRPMARRMQGLIGAEHYLRLDIRPSGQARQAEEQAASPR